jgi:regulator of replication initiation timing
MYLLHRAPFYLLLFPPDSIADMQDASKESAKTAPSESICTRETLTWRFAFFFATAVTVAIWLAMFIWSSSSSYFWAVCLTLLVESLFGIHNFTSLVKLKEQVDKIHHENLRYRVNNVKLRTQLLGLENEVDRLTDIRVDLENDRDALTRAYHTYVGFNEKFNQLLSGKESRLKVLQKSSGGLLDQWRAAAIKHQRSIYAKLWEYFELEMRSSKKDALSRLVFKELRESLPKSMRDALSENTAKEIGRQYREITREEYERIFGICVEESVSEVIDLKYLKKREPSLLL